MLKLKIKDWYDLHKGFTVEFNEGITVLVGKNGEGKTTLLRQIAEFEKKDKDVSVIEYSNYTDGGNAAKSKYINRGCVEFLAESFYNSEGQAVHYDFGAFSGEIRKQVVGDKKKIILLLDSLDSGVSIDLIKDLKKFLNFIVKDAKEHEKEIYVILSANSFEFAKKMDCVYVRSGEHYKFGTYEEYSEFICKSHKVKKAKKE